MRKIKFRVWDIRGKHFIYSYKNAGLLFGFGCRSDEDLETFGGHDLHNIIRNQESYGVAVQQFTGLLDKNGKEIYEGDIVKLEMCIEKVKDFYKDSKNTLLPIILEKIVNGDYCGVVRFDGDNGILSHFQYYVDLIPFYTLKTLTSNIEVVGNIFENETQSHE
jgi:uncharacterized phage protein (TIGR01671 family)